MPAFPHRWHFCHYLVDKIEDIEMVNRLFPNLSNKDKLKIIYYGRMLGTWGAEGVRQELFKK